MKKLKHIFIYVIVLCLIFIGLFISVEVLNSDLYGRLTETAPFETYNTPKRSRDSFPSLTLIIHKYLSDENSIEASLIISYQRQNVLSNYKSEKLEFAVRVSDGYNYNPSGFGKIFKFSDSTKRNTYGYFYSGYETDRFLLPIAPSLNGFPFDNMKIRPFLDLYVNGNISNFNFQVQKRLPGRILLFDKNDKEVIILTRTSTEKYLVSISSILFLLLTFILTYSLFKHKTGLSTIEELIAVAGYILATAGFRDIIGISRNNGTSALEILVILFPLLFVTIGLIISFRRGLKTQS